MKLVLWVAVHRSFQFLSNLLWIEQPGWRQAHRQLVVHQVAAKQERNVVHTEWFFHPATLRQSASGAAGIYDRANYAKEGAGALGRSP